MGHRVGLQEENNCEPNKCTNNLYFLSLQIKLDKLGFDLRSEKNQFAFQDIGYAVCKLLEQIAANQQNYWLAFANQTKKCT